MKALQCLALCPVPSHKAVLFGPLRRCTAGVHATEPVVHETVILPIPPCLKCVGVAGSLMVAMAVASGYAFAEVSSFSWVHA
jgi:hypothetical protein